MPLDTWQEQLRRGGLDLAILLTVSTGPLYGLAIIQHLERFTDLVVTEGTIYPILGRLTREGLLVAEWVEGEAAHARKYYRLTRGGRSAAGADEGRVARVHGEDRPADRRGREPRGGAIVILSETGESRVNGYLFVLERSLGTFLPRDTVRDAVREIESHLRERIAAADGAPNERAALEKILGELGPPLRVAQAYSAERTIDEAVATGRIVPVARAVWQLAATTVQGFFVGLGLLIGYSVGLAFSRSPRSSRSFRRTSGC